MIRRTFARPLLRRVAQKAPLKKIKTPAIAHE